MALHRIDSEIVRRDFLAAGFKLEAESDLLTDPADDHSLSVFDPALLMVLPTKSLLRLLAGIGFSIAAVAAPRLYDVAADARLALERGLSEAQSLNKEVLVIFGANWCEACRDLDNAMHGSSAALIDSRFVVVKIDVGDFYKNLDLANRYGNPQCRRIDHPDQSP